MSAGEETHSQCNVTKIPKICVDNNLEMVDCYDGGLCGKSEEDFYIAEEQTFGINELSYLSRLSCASNHKKFLLAVVLLSQCSEGYRHATLQWLNNTTMESSEGSDQVFADCEENRSTVLSSNSELLERLKKFGLQYNDKSCQHLRHDSVPNKLEDDHIEFYSIPQAKNLTNDLPSDIELITQNSQKIKKQYLELVSEKFVSSLLDDYDALIKEIQCSNAPLREVAVQTSVGQLFIATILHTSLNEDDRKWLLSSIQSKYKKMSGEDNLSSKENSMDDDLRSKLFDCLIDLGLDLSCALQRMKSDASLSHSLTSSGFLSGSGGSDSQYDLLMEASNSGSQTINTNNTLNNTKTNYGTLLTVPNADGKCGLSNSFYNCLYPFNSSSHFSYRRLSDIPTVSNFYSSPSPSSCSSSSQCPTQPASNENNEGNKTLDDTSSDSNQNTAIVANDFNDLPVVSSSELPTTVQTPAVDTDDGQAKLSSNVDCQQRVSISSTLSDSSSISSSNPDLGICVPHSPTSIVLTSTSSELVKNFENLSIYTSNSLNQCLTKTSDSEYPSDDRNSMTNQHSNMLVNNHCSSSTATSLNINIYPHMMTSHCHHPREELLDHVSINFPETQDGTSQCFSVSTNSVKAVSSNDGRCTSQYSSTTEENNFLNPFSGMTAVPFWLKSLRLHKYASLFQNLSYDEMMSITDDWLKEHDVTQGARNKILLSIEKLKHRKSILCTMEKCLSEIPSTGQLARSTVHSCLSEIKHILLTPIKPCFLQSINNHSMHLCQPVYSASACASSSSSSPSPSSSSASASASVSSSSSSSSSVVILTSGKSTMPTTLTTITTTTTTPTPTAINTMTNSMHLTCPITVIQTTDNANTEDHLIRGGGGVGVGNIHDNKSRDNNNNPCNTCNTSSIANPISNPILMNIPSINNDYDCFCNENLSYPGSMCYYQQQMNNMTNTCNQVHFENKCWSPTYPNIISTAFTNASTTATAANTESKNLHKNKEFVVTGECDEDRRDGGDDKSDDENLPGYIISCLTKVCSGLLVNAYPDANSCEEFLQILEMILSHVAFSEQQKKLVLFWKHRVLVVYGQYLNHHSHAYSSKSKSDSSNYYNYCPRSVSQVHYFDNRFRKYPTHYTSQEQQRTGSNHLGYKTFQTNSLSPSNVCFHNIQDTSSRLTMDSLEVPPQSIVDASSIHSNTSLNIPVTAEMSRRHSVSVGDPQNHLIVGKSINRRRMPSPNSPCFSGRTGVPGNINSLNLGYTNHPQASSDMELSGYPSQLPKPRFHSPSRFDPSINITPRRNLIPLATAPVTRMPSPSDVCRNNNQCSDWLSPNNRFAFPMAPFTSNISPLSTCEGSCSDNMNPDSHLLQQLQTPNVPICMLSLQNAYQNTYGSCSCLPPTKTNTHHQTLMLNSPNHPKATTLQTNQPTFDGNSRRNFLSTLNNNYSSIPCIPNSVVTNASNNTIHPPTPISSYKSTSFGNNNSLNSSCSAADKSTQLYASSSSSSVPQEVNNNIPTVGGGGCYWSNNNFSSNQASRNQISSVHEFQCLHHLYDSNNDNDNNNHNNNSNNKDLLVFVDNYIATAENNMIGGDSSDASNDRINRDLDLLTREVTEHAIGGFDSATE